MVVPAALGAALLLGCDTAARSGANPELPLWVHRPSWSMDVVYKRSIVARSRTQIEPYERGEPEIDVAGRRVFVGSSDRGLYAIRVEDGSVLWRFETLGYVQCAPLYDPARKVVYFGSHDGALYRVNADTGELHWRFMTNAEVSRRPVLQDGVLYVMNANDTLLALEAETGKRIWDYHRTPALGMEVVGYSGPLLWREKVYAGFSDGTVAAFDARTGQERWQPAVDLSAEAEQLLGEVPQYLDVDTTPVPDIIDIGPVVFVGSYAAGVYALDAETGSIVWSNPAVGGVSELMLWSEPSHPPRRGAGPRLPARKMLIAATGTTGLWALDPQDGREIWRQSLPRGGVSSPAPVAGALLISTTELGLFLISPLDGSLIDGIHMTDGSAMTPAAHGHRAFIMTNGGAFMSIQIRPPI
jgi:outer membrane protein assembly factor BamB